MFSGLTNQVSSWMSKNEEDVPQPTGEPQPVEAVPEAAEQAFENVPVGGEGEEGAKATR